MRRRTGPPLPLTRQRWVALHEGPRGDARGGLHANIHRERRDEQQIDQQEQQHK
jgi:hypothetical protein